VILPTRIALVALGSAALAGCDLSQTATGTKSKAVPGGDPARGHAIVASGAHGCTACHAIPGIRAPRGVAGPPLDGMARRAFIAGQLPNEPDVLVAFLQDPPALVPATGMPDVRLSLDEARDVAAFLYALEPVEAAPRRESGAGRQSALDPAGPSAASIHRLGTVMYAGAALVTLLVSVLMLVPILSRRERRVNGKVFLWTGAALPAAALTALVPYVLTVGHETRAPTAADHLSIDITGHLYWWDVSYRRGEALRPVATANELRLPASEPVELFLRSNDVIHSFWVPNLAGKTDMIPGRVNRMVIQADRPGLYRGQCAEYCGAQHSWMAFDVLVLPRLEFNAWLSRLARPVREPPSSQLREGRDLFVSLGCGACHTVRGVSESRLGPDLTQAGSRRMIGAGTLPGGVGNIAGWIASAQHLKPGNAMQSYDQLEGPELRALSAYLESLK
jgi:cytochrome c oxidase subunit II